MVTATAGADATPTSRPLAGPAEQAWILIQHFVDANSRHDDLANALGFRLGAGRGKVLFQLRNGPLTLSQLADANGFEAPYATLVVDKLESHGLVERQAHPDDRRRKLVALTPAGHAAIATADAILCRPPPAVSALPAHELRQLTTLVRRLIDSDNPNGRGDRLPLALSGTPPRRQDGGYGRRPSTR
ncbi:MAG: MarR family winged helix-turn-helix transcriptional regulator [Acidimicrobiales bacterium]